MWLDYWNRSQAEYHNRMNSVHLPIKSCNAFETRCVSVCGVSFFLTQYAAPVRFTKRVLHHGFTSYHPDTSHLTCVRPSDNTGADRSRRRCSLVLRCFATRWHGSRGSGWWRWRRPAFARDWWWSWCDLTRNSPVFRGKEKNWINEKIRCLKASWEITILGPWIFFCYLCGVTFSNISCYFRSRFHLEKHAHLFTKLSLQVKACQFRLLLLNSCWFWKLYFIYLKCPITEVHDHRFVSAEPNIDDGHLREHVVFVGVLQIPSLWDKFL